MRQMGRVGMARRPGKHRLQPVVQRVNVLAEHRRKPQKTAENRKDGQNPERKRHRGRGLVRMHVMMVEALPPPECEEDGAEHIEGGAEGGNRPHTPQDRVAVCKRARKNFIFGEEAAQREDAGNSQGPDQIGLVGLRHMGLQPPHLLHVLLLVHSVDHRSGTEEEQRLEEGVRHHVEHRRRVGPHTQRKEHEAELRHRRIGQHLLYIVLNQTDRCGNQRRGDRHAGDNGHGGVGHREQGGVPADKEDAGGNHRGGVDQGRHRCGAGHCVRQPDAERNLCGLAAGPQEQAERGQRNHVAGNTPPERGRLHLAVLQRSHLAEEDEHAHQHPEIADAVHHKRLFCGVPRPGNRHPFELAVVPEPDQQERAQPYPFPSEERHKKVVGKNQVQHHEDEQVQIGEEAEESAIPVHVADRIDMDQRADAGNDQKEDDRKLIELVGEVHRKFAGGDPRGNRHVLRPRLRRGSQHLKKEYDREQKREGDRRRSDCADRLFIADLFPEQPVYQKPGKGQQQNQRQ